MEKPKFDFNGDGEGDIGKSGIRLILGLIFDRKNTLDEIDKTLEKGANVIISLLVIISILVVSGIIISYIFNSIYKFSNPESIKIIDKDVDNRELILTLKNLNINYDEGTDSISMIYYTDEGTSEKEYTKNNFFRRHDNTRAIVEVDEGDKLKIIVYNKLGEQLQTINIDYSKKRFWGLLHNKIEINLDINIKNPYKRKFE